MLNGKSALGCRIQEILQRSGGKAAFGEIAAALRRSGTGQSVPLIRRVLEDGSVFVQLAHDTYGLRDLVGGQQKADGRKTVEHRPNPGEQPWIANVLSARDEYVVVDLETAGVRPGRDPIIQICLLRVVAGQPVRALNYYVNPGDRPIPYSLQVILNLDHRPEVLQAILQGPCLGDVLPQVRAEIGGLPLVAHNARFDIGFLRSVMPGLSNLAVDTLELSMVLLPGQRKYRLDNVRSALQIRYDDIQADLARLVPDLGIEAGTESLHNAAVDVFVLHHVYRALLDRLSTTSQVPWLSGLLPELGFDSSALPELHALVPTWEAWEPEASGSVPFCTGNAEGLLAEFRSAHGFTERPGQLAMVRLVSEALANAKHKVIEAPTGTGKTLAYLAPSVLFSRTTKAPVLLSTAYRNLQDQLVRDIEDLRSSTQVPFRYQLLKGFRNYFCLRALQRLLGELRTESTLSERYALACLVGLLACRPDATLDDLNYWLRSTFSDTNRLLEEVLATQDACSKQHCDFFEHCGVMAAHQHASVADIVVANHALWLSEASALPPVAHVIFDEAHALEDQATAVLTEEVSNHTLIQVLRRVYDPSVEHGVLIRFRAHRIKVDELAFGLVRRAVSLIGDFGEQLCEFVERKQSHLDLRYGVQLRLEGAPARVDRNAWQRTQRAHEQIVSCLDELVQRLDAIVRPEPTLAEDLGRELDSILSTLREQIGLLTANVRVANERKVYWIELVPEESDNGLDDHRRRIAVWALKAALVTVADDLAPRFSELESAVYTSATIALEYDDFSFVIDRLGLAQCVGPNDAHIVQGDLDYAHSVFLGLPTFLTYAPLPRTMKSFQEELAEEFKLFLQFTDGRALGLFTARERMEYVFSRCEESLGEVGIPLYCQQPGASRAALLEEFTSRPESVLFGLRSFWEGIDVPGQTLSFVLMEKLPFPFYFDPVFKARREAVVKRNGNEFDDYVFPLMALQFKQGFGRLIRRSDDRGAVILYDKRLHKKAYKERLLHSLPGFLPRDPAAERDRPAFYRAIAESLPGLIDLDAKQDLLSALPATILTDLEALLQRYRLPDVVTADQYAGRRSQIVEALEAVFGYRNGFLSVEQEKAVQHLLAGDDALVLLPTGGGKSLCFQLPALLQSGVTLVFSPLIALMRDQVQALLDRGIEVIGAIYAGQSVAEREDLLQRMRVGRARLVYISPERLRDRQLLRALATVPVRRIVVDEAHCVSLWGPQFRPDFLHIDRLFAQLDYRPPVAAFTATATLAIRREIGQELQLRDPALVEASFNRPELRFLVYNQHSCYSAIRNRNDRFRALLRILRAADRNRDPVLVYVATTAESDLLARRLRLIGYDARSYHGKMDTADRESVQQLFMDDDVNIVVCTKAFGMGIDKRDVRYVIHYNMPGDLESYFQEAGRAGRDRKPAWCVLLYHSSDRSTQEYFIDESIPAVEELNEVLTWLRQREGEPCLVQPSEMTDFFGVEETRLRVLLHLLEKDEFLVRHEDVTSQASTTLHYSPMEIAAFWENREARMACCWRRLEDAELPIHRRFGLNVLDLARKTGLPATVIDELFTEGGLFDLVTYRPWEKAWSISRSAKLLDGHPYVGDEGERMRCSHELEAKLNLMEGYAQTRSGGLCRRAQILNYFAQSAPERCGTCDVCAPEMSVPWADIGSEDFAPLEDYLDLKFTLLEAISWNQEQGAPVGSRALVQVLTGNTYLLTQHISGEAGRQRRLRRLRDCPYWSAFSTLPRSEATLTMALQQLEREGYVTGESRCFSTANETVEYQVPVLTESGKARLASGEHYG